MTTEHETNAEYHADDTHVGASMLSDFRDNAALYKGVHVTHTIPRPPPTKPMRMGSALHTLVLEPDRWDLEYLVAPDGVTAHSRNKWAELLAFAEVDYRTVLAATEAEAARHMAASLLENKRLRVLMEAAGTRTERAIRWTDVATGIKCKCRPDLLVDDPGLERAWLPDLKTSNSPGPDFPKSCANYGYARGMAHYMEGAATVIDRPLHPYYFVVRNSEPWDVWEEYRLSQEDFIDPGFRSRQYWLQRLARCMETNDWTSPEQTEPGELKLPYWELKGAEYE